MNVRVEKVTVTLRQREILMLMSRRSQVCIGDLALLLGVSYVAVIKMVNRLEQKELVRRIRFFGEASSSPQAMPMAMA